MALEFAHGAIQWLAADAVSTVYTVSGLPFQPKAIRFYHSGIQASSGDSATSNNANARPGVGLATSTSDRRAVSGFETFNSASMDCATAYRTDCVVVTVDGAGVVQGLLDLNSITAIGFTLIVDDQINANITIFWEAWGGSDITSAATGEISEPAATGNVDYTVTGSFQPDVVMFAGVQATGAAPTTLANDLGMCVGFATGGTAASNVVIATNQDDGSASADTDSYGLTGECIAMMTLAGGNPSARAQMTQFNAGGFRLNWIARGTTARKYIYLAIKGGRWRSGGFTIASGLNGSTGGVSDNSYTPVGVCLIGTNKAASTAGTSTVEGAIGFGTSTGSGNSRAAGYNSYDGTASSTINTTLSYNYCLQPKYGSASAGLISMTSFASTGFTVTRGEAGVANELYGYLLFDSNAANNALIGSTAFAFTDTATISGAGALIGSLPATFNPTSTIKGDAAAVGSTTFAFAGSSAIQAFMAAIGATQFNFSPSSTIQASGALLGAGAVAFAPSGIIGGDIPAIGSTSFGFINTSTIQGLGGLVGSSPWAFLLDGLLADLPAMTMNGICVFSFSPLALIEANGALLGQSPVLFSPASIIQGSASLIGQGNVAFSPAGIIVGSGSLIGQLAAAFLGSGTIVGSGALMAQSGMSFSPVAIISGSGVLIGQIPVAFYPASIIEAIATLVGQGSVAFAPSGVIEGSGSLIGQLAAAFLGSGTIVGSGALVAQSGVQFSPSGIIQGMGELIGQLSTFFDLSGIIEGEASLIGNLGLQFSGGSNMDALAAMFASSNFAFDANSVIEGIGDIAGYSNLLFSNQGIIQAEAMMDGSIILTITVTGASATGPVRRIILIT